MNDLGFPVGVTSHISLHVPAGTPPEIVEKPSAALEPLVQGEMVQNVGEKRVMDMLFRDPKAAAAVMKKDSETYEEVINTVGPMTPGRASPRPGVTAPPPE